MEGIFYCAGICWEKCSRNCTICPPQGQFIVACALYESISMRKRVQCKWQFESMIRDGAFCWHQWRNCCAWWWTFPNVAGVRIPPTVWLLDTLKMEAVHSSKAFASSKAPQPKRWYYSPTPILYATWKSCNCFAHWVLHFPKDCILEHSNDYVTVALLCLMWGGIAEEILLQMMKDIPVWKSKEHSGIPHLPCAHHLLDSYQGQST